MSDNQTPEQSQNVTELPKQKRKFDYKKIAKHVAFGLTAVGAAVVIFKLASAPDYSEQFEITEKPTEPEVPQSA